MSVPVWTASPLRASGTTTNVVSLLEVSLTGQRVVVKDSEIGVVYLDTYVYTPSTFSLTVNFNANGVESVEVTK